MEDVAVFIIILLYILQFYYENTTLLLLLIQWLGTYLTCVLVTKVVPTQLYLQRLKKKYLEKIRSIFCIYYIYVWRVA